MNIAICCDHGGLQLKQQIATYLQQKGYCVVDFGTNSLESCDYPDFAHKAANAIASGRCQFGVFVCTTGIGVSMVANKTKGVRCALCTNVDMATLTRQHNNANAIAFGQKYVSFPLAQQMLDAFLSAEFLGGRHAIRVAKIETEE
ncbi:MAG: ribose 5-phosphate isomerase B [Clostridia bacterium]|nr:ribose 5-phosphate isomerase B [Clostridia bacterium]